MIAYLDFIYKMTNNQNNSKLSNDNHGLIALAQAYENFMAAKEEYQKSIEELDKLIKKNRSHRKL